MSVQSLLMILFRRKEYKKWKDYWSPEKKRILENTIIKAGEKYGFKKDAFNEFYYFTGQKFSTC